MEALPGIGRPGGVPSTYPPGPCLWDEWDSVTAEEVGHHVVGGSAVGTGGVIGPAYGVVVGLKP